MASIYTIPMSRAVLAAFLAVMASVAAVVAWSFNSGLTWTAICLIAVAGPLGLFYWYMLYITPRRASVTVSDEGILLAAPPFASAVIPWASVEKVFPADLKRDESFQITKTRKYMSFGGYKSGVVEVKDGREAVIVANRNDVLCIRTGERFYLIGPADLSGFTAAVEKVAP
ncbi:hypothetical protein DND132_1308 [Pseudodesulfovibrio mercurii]|uniref:Bacterial Pleckstrin homology domain-containing protein n=1 Tax=Pseudodesulfovibrio mercurii TaxID=641491 RepID=F0JD25_9BACT|nr:PH domain-containing protein [Pseudodesulfovibrio mercurii]EGB14517.1 hypothetical protein DND132_1308 [Pseudodesulfovibrio mercurii]